MKKAFLLSTLLLFVATYLSQAQEDSNYNLLWKIEKADHAEASYIFGTMHVQDEKAFNFSDSVMIALEGCKQFSLEIHPDTLVKAIFKEILDPDTTNHYKNFLEEKEYENFISNFEKEHGYSFEELESKNPIAVNSIKESKSIYKNDRQTIVDMYLFGIAKTLKKPVFSLEDVENQLELLKQKSFKRAKYNVEIDTTFKFQIQKEMLESYSSGNLENLSVITGNMTNDKFFIKRNVDMTKNLIALMETSSTFAAVGAAHLIGDRSIIAMLEKEGYTVSKVSSTFTGVADNYSIDPALLPWTIVNNEKAAVLFDFPETYNDLTRDVPNPYDEKGDPITIYLWVHSDLTSMTNYIFAYNDLSPGLYLETKESGFEAFEEDIKTKSKILSPGKSIYKDGVEGKSYELLFDNLYYAQVEVYIRGNRMYKFLAQNLSPGAKKIKENNFLSSIHFLPFQNTTLQLNKEDHPILAFPMFEDYYIEKEENEDYDYYFEDYESIASNNPQSGGSYITVIYDVSPFYQIASLDTFYESFSDGLLSWNDTLLYQNDLVVDEVKGKEIAIKNLDNNLIIRSKFWLKEGHLFYKSAYVDSTEIWSSTIDDFFKMGYIKRELKPFDIYTSKTTAILEGLQSKDSIIYKKAVGAFNYYPFDKEDLPQLNTALKQHYSMETNNDNVVTNFLNQKSTINTIVNSLLNEIGIIDDSSSIQFLTKLYQNAEAPDEHKAKLLTTLIELDAVEEFSNLFLQDPPKELNSTYYIFQPFKDSLDLALEHYDDLLKLIEIPVYRKDLLSLSTLMLKEDKSIFTKKILDSNEKLMAYNEDIIATYKKEKEEENYYYPYELYNVLNFCTANPNNHCASFLNQLSTIDTIEYLKEKILITKLYNNLEVPASDIDSLIKDNSYIFELITAYDDIDRFDLLPDSLQQEQTIAKYKLQDYLYDDLYYKDLVFFNEITFADSVFFVYKLMDEEEDEEKEGEYLAYAGPISRKNNDFKIKDLQAYYIWRDFKEEPSWQKAIEESLPDFRDWAY